jgi:hypothetical protein
VGEARRAAACGAGVAATSGPSRRGAQAQVEAGPSPSSRRRDVATTRAFGVRCGHLWGLLAAHPRHTANAFERPRSDPAATIVARIRGASEFGALIRLIADVYKWTC